ncbi:hypothetical protein TNIN_421381 [Trichonephila inaurata madagascariensis]|uniref:Uncharacterized protein n=1 Tax=Trichonephila inaurata madagascariensis TaxID=2747483 RepID=A0A8X7C3D6_9ARAC|nr:hypothetical protein TNIN_421381 [Trichonephila inaurata madagascariensis]
MSGSDSDVDMNSEISGHSFKSRSSPLRKPDTASNTRTNGYKTLLKKKSQERETLVRELQNLPPCTNPDCPDHFSALADSVNLNSMKNSQTEEPKTLKTNTKKNKAQKRKDNQDDFVRMFARPKRPMDKLAQTVALYSF